MSVSTAGAGPSVQLVERMSATVRKLEMEKAASREAMARLQGQRDEAREEIVTMMCEVDELKVDHKKMSDLEAQMQEVQSKFDHVLEMLGEKTERCEDLENDVKLWKNLYQEHLDSTTK
jgi:archaellum component FlaC